MKTLTLDYEKQGSIYIVTLSGILNADTSTQLEEILHKLSDEEIPNILLNIADLTYISSAGIGCFIGVIKKIRNKEGDLRFSQSDAKVKRVFQLLDMDDFFQFFPSLEEGIASFPG